MLCLILLGLASVAFANPYGCPTNVTCVEKQTCCETNMGLWACCPLEDGLCCDDGLHCCHKSQRCLPNGNCSSFSNELTAGFPLRSRPIEITSVPCPDGHSYCPDGQTCCQLSSGQYGCCPLPDAVCCSDHLHCCPHGYTCDTEHSRCMKGFDVNDVTCPGGETVCGDGQTCCQLSSGDYGCCPLPDATCCNDHMHCCPYGYTCDIEKNRCLKGIAIDWFTKRPALRRSKEMVALIDPEKDTFNQLSMSSTIDAQIICPDATSLCPSTSTCCLTTDSTWGCCPVEKAVCCNDHQHCCPTHYKCDLHVFKCDHPEWGSVPMLKKHAALLSVPSRLILSESPSLSTIQCPDEKSFCPEDTTCCELTDGAYGCCPYPQASCCADKVHCCANGYSCDDTGSRCIRHSRTSNRTHIVPSVLKLKPLSETVQECQRYCRSPLTGQLECCAALSPLIPVPVPVADEQTCADGVTTCPASSTCCPNKDQNPTSYSCCPYSKGVCCGSVGSVCCPSNYICDEKQLSCQLNETISIRSRSLEIDYSQCESSDISCPPTFTCCKTHQSTGDEFACCAYTDGVCCSDGRHCCRAGTKCDIHSGGCAPGY